MSVMHPLAIVNVASITSLVRMTLCDHSIRVYHATVERNEGVAVLGAAARNVAAEDLVAPLVSDIPGVRKKKVKPAARRHAVPPHDLTTRSSRVCLTAHALTLKGRSNDEQVLPDRPM